MKEVNDAIEEFERNLEILEDSLSRQQELNKFQDKIFMFLIVVGTIVLIGVSITSKIVGEVTILNVISVCLVIVSMHGSIQNRLNNKLSREKELGFLKKEICTAKLDLKIAKEVRERSEDK